MNEKKTNDNLNKKNYQKRQYTTPTLVEYGNLTDLTQSAGQEDFDGHLGTEGEA